MRSFGVAVVAAALIAQGNRPPASGDWPVYLGDKARTHYSPLDQITKDNVASLEVAWTYDTGDRGEFQSNALVVDGVLYTASPTRKVIALDAATGHASLDVGRLVERPGNPGNRQRGLVYWADGDDRRILTSAGQHLYALNAKTGEVIRSFGENGSLLLAAGIELDGGRQAAVTLNTPGVIYKDMYIVGGNTNTPGAIRAYDVRTGALKWIFYTIPRPGEFGYDTWPVDAYKNATIGGASNWTGAALDEARGIVYVPTEEATPDNWGADREGANLFANTLLALDANTGQRLWHYQIVHHDLNDKDLPTPPVLLTVTQNGRRIDAVAQGTKHGLLFVFDRVTGQPLWPIEERPVPQTDLPGEKTWPTQPFPTRPAPLMRQLYTASEVSNISPEANKYTTERFQVLGSSGPFAPPSLKETIFFPGWDGGMEWGGAAADLDGTYYVNVNEIPWLYQMVAVKHADGTPVGIGERGYQTQCAACHGLDRAGNPAGGFPSLVDIGNRRTADQLAQILDKGTGGRMPLFGRMQEGQRRAIVDFLLGNIQPDASYGIAAGRGGREDAPYAFGGFRRYFDQQGYPAIKPPWGTLNAVDLNTGDIKWKVPLGEYTDLTAKGIPPTGTENYGGPVVTAGGLIFIAATADETIRAFDKETGRILWQAKLPFGGNATPSVYMVNGRQYVVISAGGGKSGRPAGGIVVAFALPK
jgi:quinoprotein glucose dehydrogenase